MLDTVVSFIKKYQSFILTTHDPADADGLGAELVFAAILKSRGKEVRVVNASEVPALFQFMDPARLIERWDPEIHGNLPGKSALLIVDTSDEYNIGVLKNIVDTALDVIAVDHHEPKPLSTLGGLLDPSAAATCELAVEIAEALRVELDACAARAAYAGLVYDTGFFAYSKTTLRTFAAAQKMIALGAVPYEVYRHLNENASIGALLLHKRVLSTLELYAKGTVAVQVMRKEDLAATGARFEDAEGFINVPMRAGEIAVSVLVKETPEGKVRCSLRSGGGHVSAAGFRSGMGIEETLQEVIEKVIAQLDGDR